MGRFKRPPAKRWTAQDLARFGAFYGGASAVVDTLERPNRRALLTLVIPFPPSTNHDKAPTGNGGQYLLPETKAFRDGVSALVLAQRAPWVKGPYTVAITLYPPDKRAYDIDNRIKPTLDALQAAGVLENDRQVKRLIVSEATVKEGGEAIVTIEGEAVPEELFR